MTKVDKLVERQLEEGNNNRPRPGQQFGIPGGDMPENYDAYDLSRVVDMLRYMRIIGLDHKDLFRLLPDDLKLDFNYANWQYELE